MKSLPEFINELQASDARRQTRWVWGASLFSFLFIFSIWGVSLKYNLPTTPNNNDVPIIASDSDASLAFTMRQGLATITTTIRNAASAKNTFEISHSSIQYQPTPSPLPVLPITTFPSL